MTTLFKDKTYYLETSVIGADGSFVVGLSVTYEIRKNIDNSLVTYGLLAPIGNIYSTTVLFNSTGLYRVLYTTPDGYENGLELFSVENLSDFRADISMLATQSSISSMDVLLRRILGLSQENYRLFSPTYDTNNNLLSAIIKTYINKNDCNADVNEMALYNLLATYNLNGVISTYKVTKE